MVRAGATASGAEAVDHPLAVALTWTEDAGRVAGAVEGRLIRRVGEEAGLEAEALPVAERSAAAPDDGAVEEVAGVELNPGCVGEDIKRTSGSGFRGPGSEAEACGDAEVEAMVVTAGQAQLQVLGADALADAARVAEIKRRALDGGAFPSGDQGRVGRDETFRWNRQGVVEDVALTGEVEERVFVRLHRVAASVVPAKSIRSSLESLGKV